MSTFLSSLFSLFFTFTLQPGRRISTRNAMANEEDESTSRRFGILMFCSSLGDLWLPLDSCAALRNVGNTHWQMAANGDFTKKRFDRADFRNRHTGKCTEIV